MVTWLFDKLSFPKLTKSLVVILISLQATWTHPCTDDDPSSYLLDPGHKESKVAHWQLQLLVKRNFCCILSPLFLKSKSGTDVIECFCCRHPLGGFTTHKRTLDFPTAVSSHAGTPQAVSREQCWQSHVVDRGPTDCENTSTQLPVSFGSVFMRHFHLINTGRTAHTAV